MAGNPQRAKGNGAGDAERAGITPDLVLATAGRIVEEDGVGALTMRRLAGELGVAPPTIYWHVGNKKELLDRLLDRFAAEVGEITVRGTDPRDRIRSVLKSLHEEVRARPELAHLAKAQGVAESLYASAEAALVKEIRDAGVPTAAVAPAVHAFLTFFASFYMFETLMAGYGDSYHWGGLDHVVARMPELEPELVASLSADADVPAVFDYMLDALIDRVLAEVPARRRRVPAVAARPRRAARR